MRKIGTEVFDKQHRHFGGLIFPTDFCTYYPSERGRNAIYIERDFLREENLQKQNYKIRRVKS